MNFSLIKNSNRIKYLLLLSLVELLLINNAILAENLTLSDITAQLNSDKWFERENAALSLVKSHNIEKKQAVDLLLSTLIDEINSPLSIEKLAGSDGNITEVLKNVYCSAICSLGNDIVPYLEEKYYDTKGEYRDWLVVIIGFQQSEKVHSELRTLVIDNKNGWLRLKAIKALKMFHDSIDVDIFKTALADSFVVTRDSHVSNEMRYVYPIRAVAAGALKQFGYEVKRQGYEFIIVKKTE